MLENPYRAPGATALDDLSPSSSSAQPFWQVLRRWLGIGAANAQLAGFIALGIYVQFEDLVGVIFGFSVFVGAIALLDYLFLRAGWKFLSDALKIGAIAKAVLQLVVIVDILLGVVATTTVASVVGKMPFLTAFLTTLAYGLLALAVALTLGIGLNGLWSISARYKSNHA